MLGEHNRDVTDETRTIRSDIAVIVNHPDYNKGTHNNYDFSLVKLTTKIDFAKTPNVRPICLPKDGSNDFSGFIATVSGWGKSDEEGKLSNVLQEVDVKVIGDDDCKDNFKYESSEITDQMLCAHVEGGGKDSCQGDSGKAL